MIDKTGTQAIIRPNHLFPPFNNAKARQALLYLVGDQKDTFAVMVGRPDLEIPCWAVFVCNTPLATTAGVGDWAKGNRKANLEKAKQLLKESGYDGRPIVMLDPTDQALIHKGVLVVAEGLREIGANVDLQAMVWTSLLARRQVKDAPGTSSQGWNIVFHLGRRRHHRQSAGQSLGGIALRRQELVRVGLRRGAREDAPRVHHGRGTAAR